MSAVPIDLHGSAHSGHALSRGRVAMYSLIVAEAAIFLIFVAAYIFYLGKSLTGPTPDQVLTVPAISTICLLSSSFTIHWATHALKKGAFGIFKLAWFITLALGAIFLMGTAREWHDLIYNKGFTISTNLAGTTYYSLVGLHASHVAIGLIALTTVMIAAVLGKVKQEHTERCEVLALYWHFVDVVWVVVFTVVYGLGR
jgi:cytochrome c oxidase subunit 3